MIFGVAIVYCKARRNMKNFNYNFPNPPRTVAGEMAYVFRKGLKNCWVGKKIKSPRARFQKLWKRTQMRDQIPSPNPRISDPSSPPPVTESQSARSSPDNSVVVTTAEVHRSDPQPLNPFFHPFRAASKVFEYLTSPSSTVNGTILH